MGEKEYKLKLLKWQWEHTMGKRVSFLDILHGNKMGKSKHDVPQTHPQSVE